MNHKGGEERGNSCGKSEGTPAVPRGREMTLEEERQFLVELFAGSIGHDGWFSPSVSKEGKEGEKNGR